MSAPLDAPASARRIGALCWIEQQLFALFGGWVAEVADVETRLVLLELGEHAAWRAMRWYELLPTAPPGADALLEPTPSFEAAIVAAAGAPVTDRSTALRDALDLLELVDGFCAEHQQLASPLAEAAVLRIVAIARTDIALDQARARAIIER